MPSRPRGPTPPRPARQAGSKPQSVGLLQQADALIAAGKQTAAPGQQKPKCIKLSYTGRGLAAHQEMNRALQEIMVKDHAAASSSHVPAQTIGGGNLGDLEHYRQAWNAADFGILDGQDQLGPSAMSLVGLPPVNTQPDSPIGLGYRMFSLKAAMLDADHGLEVNNPNHRLLHVYLLLSAKSISTISPRDPGGAKFCSIRISQEMDFARRVPEFLSGRLLTRS